MNPDMNGCFIITRDELETIFIESGVLVKELERVHPNTKINATNFLKKYTIQYDKEKAIKIGIPID